MKLKTTLLALVVVLALCGTFTFVAVANADLELSLDSASAMPGETVTLTLNIDQNPGIYYLGMYFDYDKEALTLKSVSNKSGLTYMGGIQHIWYANGIDNNYSSGTLAVLTFVVNEGAANGDYEIGFLSGWEECYNADEDDVTINFTKGVITVCDHSATKTSTVKPTCTESGETITYCAYCDVELGRAPIAPLGHTAGKWVVDADPGCTTEGYEHLDCAVCGDTYEYAAIPAKGHGEECGVEVETPTCTETGETWYVCMDCDEVLRIETVPAKGHVAGVWATQKEPTCTAEGLDIQLCSVCKATVDTLVTAKLPHNYDNGTVTTEPTCVKEGVLTYACVDCGHSYTESIAIVPHTYDALGICTVCGTESALYISATETKCLLGETFTVTLDVERNSGIFYLSLYLDYDMNALELVSVDNGSLLSLTSGKIYVWSASSENVTETGTLVTFTFAVKETATAETTYPIDITIYECYDENEASVDAVAGNASVYVFDYIYGDANGDGIVNGKDATRLMRYLASLDPTTGESSIEVEPGADANGDGIINGKDATRLMRYLASLDPITGESSVVLGPSK